MWMLRIESGFSARADSALLTAELCSPVLCICWFVCLLMCWSKDNLQELALLPPCESQGHRIWQQTPSLAVSSCQPTLVFCLLGVFLDRILQCSPGWTETCYVDHSGLNSQIFVSCS